jgi:hypothetical protein
MARRRIGQEAFGFVQGERGRNGRLDAIAVMLDRAPIERLLQDIHAAAKGEPAWPPLALFKALLMGLWHDLSDVALAEALDDRASFRRISRLCDQRGDPGAERFRAVPARTGGPRARRTALRRDAAADRGARGGGADRDAGRRDRDPAGGDCRRPVDSVRIRRKLSAGILE